MTLTPIFAFADQLFAWVGVFLVVCVVCSPSVDEGRLLGGQLVQIIRIVVGISGDRLLRCLGG